MASNTYPAIIIGAGPAGLATSQQLTIKNISHVVLEQGPELAYKWSNLYDSLTLHTGRKMSSLPGMPFPDAYPSFIHKNDFLEYLRNYSEKFNLPIKTNFEVSSANRKNDQWEITTANGVYLTDHLIVAAGILSNPHIPGFNGQERFIGKIFHSHLYKNPQSYIGNRVLVIGLGNSCGEISAELANAGIEVFVSIRSGTLNLPREIFGIPIQYFSLCLRPLPRSIQKLISQLTGKFAELKRGRSIFPKPKSTRCPDVPLIGFQLADAVRDGNVKLKGNIKEIIRDGVRFEDGSEEKIDEILLATGYNATVNFMGNLISLDECGFAKRKNRVESTEQPNLYFVGHNYDTAGGLYNIKQDSRIVGRIVPDRLSKIAVGINK